MLGAIFVVGTGRSGTHFLTRLLNGFERIYDPMQGKENRPILQKIALSAIKHKPLPRDVHNYYRAAFEEAGPRVFLDQHHPNLFFAEEWIGRYPSILCLFPERPVHQVVASMMRHNGVLSWYSYAKERKNAWPGLGVRYPNQFLGLMSKSEIDALPLHMLCAKRVMAHNRKFRELKRTHPDSVRAVAYENLVRDPEGEFRRLFREDELASIGGFTLKETPRAASLTKYKDVLTDGQVAEIMEFEASAA